MTGANTLHCGETGALYLGCTTPVSQRRGTKFMGGEKNRAEDGSNPIPDDSTLTFFCLSGDIWQSPDRHHRFT